MLLGYGVLSYFTFLKMICALLLIITFFCLPLFYIYRQEYFEASGESYAKQNAHGLASISSLLL